MKKASTSSIQDDFATQEINAFKLSRRSTDELCKRLSHAHSQATSSSWYEPGMDFCYYVHAQHACKSTRTKLRKLKLSALEEQLLNTTEGVNVALDKLKSIQEEEEKRASKSSLMEHTSSFVNGFSDFIVRISGIVQTMLPQSPEYTITYGVLLLIFKAVVTKKERQASLSNSILSLSNRLPVVGFYREVFPTNAMKVAVASVYAGLMNLLDEALVYYRSGRVGKIIDAVIQPAESKFAKHVQEIELSIDKMNYLKDAAHIAQQNDMQDTVKDTGHIVARLFYNFQTNNVAISSGIAMLNQKIDSIQSKTDHFYEIEAFKYSLLCQDSLSPDEFEQGDDPTRFSRQDFHLSPKDQWENNGILEHLITWSASGRNSLLWIGGSSGNQDSWVTDFSLDMIQAFQTQSSTLLYALCGNLSSARFFTPCTLISSLIMRVLNIHPSLAYQNPDICNQRRFVRAKTFNQLWCIFLELAVQIPELFIIVDRVEQCRPNEDANLSSHLLPNLMELAKGERRISVIVTSVYDPPEGFGDHDLTSVYIDTGKRARRRHL